MCTLEQRGRVFVLTLTGTGEHRLNPDLISALRSSLAPLLSSPPPSVTALVTVAEGNFFSNGLDLAWARSDPSRLHHMVSLFSPLVADLISLPMPTVAAVTGHAAAAGFILALSHDHVIMRRDRGVLYMSELDIGKPIPGYLITFLRAKIRDPRTLRDVALKSAKVRGEEALARGLVDRVVHGSAETAEAAVKLAEELAGRGWKGDVYVKIRKGIFPELCRSVGVAVDEEEKGTSKAIVASKL